jgi:hypothetical protein
MNKRIRFMLPCLIALAFIFYPLQTLAARQQTPLVAGPLWVMEGGYANAGQANLEGNGALMQSLEAFWQQYARHVTANYTGLMPVQDAPPALRNGIYVVDKGLSDKARQAISQGFGKDTLRLPFSQTYLDMLLSNMLFYFALAPEINYSGQYVTAGNESFVFSKVSERQTQREHPDWAQRTFIQTLLHELGHAMGLGETLTDLFTETIMGFEYSIRGPNAFDYQNYQGNGGFAYDSTFDRTLLRALEAQGRGHELWEAAFHSNAAYEALWDEHFSAYATLDELQTARGLYFALTYDTGGGAAGAAAFEQAAGTSVESAGQQMLLDWRMIMGESHPENLHSGAVTEEQRNAAIVRFRRWVEYFASYANSQEIAPQPHVLDIVINTHIIREYGFNPYINDSVTAYTLRRDGLGLAIQSYPGGNGEQGLYVIMPTGNFGEALVYWLSLEGITESDAVQSVNELLRSYGYRPMDGVQAAWLRRRGR